MDRDPLGQLVVSHEDALSLPRYDWRNSLRKPFRHIKTVCSIENCLSPVKGRGRCDTHLKQFENERGRFYAHKRNTRVKYLENELKGAFALAQKYKLRAYSAEHKLDNIKLASEGKPPLWTQKD